LTIALDINRKQKSTEKHQRYVAK